MQFLIKAYDGPDRLDRRMAVRPDHLSGMRALGKRVVFAGGLLDEAGIITAIITVRDAVITGKTAKPAAPIYFLVFYFSRETASSRFSAFRDPRVFFCFYES